MKKRYYFLMAFFLIIAVDFFIPPNYQYTVVTTNSFHSCINTNIYKIDDIQIINKTNGNTEFLIKYHRK